MPKKYKQSASLFKRWDPTILLALGVLLAGMMIYGIMAVVKYLKYDTNLFILKEIVVQGNTYLPEKTILKLAAVQTGVKLFDVDTRTIQKKILQNKYIQNVVVKHTLPATLSIYIQERQPVVYLRDKGLYFVDASGIILKKLPTMSPKDLPEIRGFRVRQLLVNREPVFKALKLMKIIREVDPDLVYLIAAIEKGKQNQLQLRLRRGNVLVYLDPLHPYSKLYALSEFVKNSRILNELPRMRWIDLRYQDRIYVRFKRS